MPSVPYEVLNALEWDTDRVNDGEVLIEDEDEWADGQSTTSASGQNTQANHPPTSNVEAITLHDTTDSQQWTAVTRASRGKINKSRKAPNYVQSSVSSSIQAATNSTPAKAPSKTQPTTSARSPSNRKPASASKKQIPQRQVKSLAQAFNFPRDNAAKAAYRNRRPYNGMHMLHKDAGEIERDQSKLYHFLDGLGIRFKTFIRPPQGPNERQILLWGQTSDIDRTIRHIKQWERSAEAGPVPKNAKARGVFATVKSSATHDYEKGIKRLDREAAFKIYQQIPEPGKQFPFQGWVIWEFEEASPNDVFGVSLEAFDPIRRQNKCHIVFEETCEALRVLASTRDHMDRAVRRIRNAIEGLRMQSTRDIAKYFIDVTGLSAAVHEDVALIRPQSNQEGVTGPVIPCSHGNIIKQLEVARWNAECEQIREAIQGQIEQAFKSIIPLLQHQAGQIQIRIHFGMFGLTKFPLEAGNKSLPLRTFLERMATPGVKGELSRGLGVRQNWNTIIDHLRSSPLFETTDSTSEAEYIQARYIINRVDKPAVRYVKDVTRAVTGTYDLDAGRWSRDDGRDSRVPLQIFMAQLDSQTSWKLQIANHQGLDEAHVDPQMDYFAESLAFDCKDIQNVHRSGRKQFSFRSDTQILQPSMFEQKTSCHYRLTKAPQWTVEISRFDRYRPDSELPVTTNWSASMFNHDWDALLSRNDRLKIGEHAEWEPSLETFLPSMGSDDSSTAMTAVGDLLETIRTVTNFFDDMRRM